MEYIKLIKFYSKNKYLSNIYESEINIYKNRFVNLNINYCDGITPCSVPKYNLENGNYINIWTHFKVKSNITEEILEEIQNNTMKKIEFMTSGNSTVYDGDTININFIEKKSNILVLLEDIPIGISVLIS